MAFMYVYQLLRHFIPHDRAKLISPLQQNMFGMKALKVLKMFSLATVNGMTLFLTGYSQACLCWTESGHLQ